jgi:hypothetical protein
MHDREWKCMEEFVWETRREEWWEDHITMGFKEVGWREWTGFIWLSLEARGHSCEHCKVLLASHVGLLPV